MTRVSGASHFHGFGRTVAFAKSWVSPKEWDPRERDAHTYGARLPFANTELLWRTKQTSRERDGLDIEFPSGHRSATDSRQG